MENMNELVSIIMPSYNEPVYRRDDKFGSLKDL
jgi:hypothetical protein